MHKKSLQSLKLPIILCSTLLLALTTGTLFLSLGNSSADEVLIDVTLNPNLSMTLSPQNTVTMELTPTPEGHLATSLLTATVSTNNPTGYNLVMSSKEQDKTSLTHTTDSASTLLSTTAPIESPESLQSNTWGYRTWSDQEIENNTPPTLFNLIPNLKPSHTLKITEGPLANDITKLTFAAKVDITALPGHYQNTMVLSATTNYVPGPIKDGTYMQDITSRMCQDTPTNLRPVVIDRRNDQHYFIQRIGDLCWMETNLRYAGDGDWDPASGYPDDRYATSTTNDTANTNDDIRPLTMTSSGYFGGSSANAFTVAGVADAGGSPTLDTTAPENNTTFYGYLYNWCAAMGGQLNTCNNSSTTDIDTTTSICPAGWRLPTGSSGGEYQSLNTAINGGSTTSDQGLRDNFLAVYSGDYRDILNYQGERSVYWSSTVYDATTAYDIYSTSEFSRPGTDTSTRSYGFAIRCVL